MSVGFGDDNNLSPVAIVGTGLFVGWPAAGLKYKNWEPYPSAAGKEQGFFSP
jgi:hypothetical protein